MLSDSKKWFAYVYMHSLTLCLTPDNLNSSSTMTLLNSLPVNKKGYDFMD